MTCITKRYYACHWTNKMWSSALQVILTACGTPVHQAAGMVVNRWGKPWGTSPAVPRGCFWVGFAFAVKYIFYDLLSFHSTAFTMHPFYCVPVSIGLHFHICSYNTFCGYPPDIVKKMPKRDLAEEVWRLQAALGEQTEITKFSQQEFERLQNVRAHQILFFLPHFLWTMISCNSSIVRAHNLSRCPP